MAATSKDEAFSETKFSFRHRHIFYAGWDAVLKVLELSQRSNNIASTKSPSLSDAFMAGYNSAHMSKPVELLYKDWRLRADG